MNTQTPYPNHSLRHRKLAKSVATAVCVAGLLTATVAEAVNLHFAGPVTAVQNGDTVVTSGKVAGLGSAEPLTITVTVEGTAEFSCTNPSGKNNPPGQNQFEEETVIDIEPDDFEKSGNVNFTIPVEVPEGGAVAGAPDCPNGNWTQNQVVEVDQITIVAEQGNPTATTICTPDGNGFDCETNV